MEVVEVGWSGLSNNMVSRSHALSGRSVLAYTDSLLEVVRYYYQWANSTSGGLPTSSSTSSIDGGGLMAKERCPAIELWAMIAGLAAYLSVRELVSLRCDNVKLTKRPDIMVFMRRKFHGHVEQAITAIK